MNVKRKGTFFGAHLLAPQHCQGRWLATVLKVYGEGERKVRQHGWSKRRTWRKKLHLGVDESSGEMVAVLLTTNTVGNGEMLPYLLEQVKGDIEQVSGDGAYDTRDCYQDLAQRNALLPGSSEIGPFPPER